MKLKFFLITIILFLNSCGYTPMYSSANKADFYLEKINLNGDEFQSFMMGESSFLTKLKIVKTMPKIPFIKEIFN